MQQMSKEWILRTLNKLEKYKPLPEYDTIKNLLEHDQYRARLFKMPPKVPPKYKSISTVSKIRG